MDGQATRPRLTLAAINVAVYGRSHRIRCPAPTSRRHQSSLSALCGRVAAPQIEVSKAVCIKEYCSFTRCYNWGAPDRAGLFENARASGLSPTFPINVAAAACRRSAQLAFALMPNSTPSSAATSINPCRAVFAAA